MQTTLTRWGNNLGLRIPKEMAGRFHLAEGARVNLEAEGDRIIITMPGRYRLADLVAGITPADLHDAFDWGPEIGREEVD